MFHAWSLKSTTIDYFRLAGGHSDTRRDSHASVRLSESLHGDVRCRFAREGGRAAGRHSGRPRQPAQRAKRPARRTGRQTEGREERETEGRTGRKAKGREAKGPPQGLTLLRIVRADFAFNDRHLVWQGKCNIWNIQ